jgi:hypothetical protein
VAAATGATQPASPFSAKGMAITASAAVSIGWWLHSTGLGCAADDDEGGGCLLSIGAWSSILVWLLAGLLAVNWVSWLYLRVTEGSVVLTAAIALPLYAVLLMMLSSMVPVMELVSAAALLAASFSRLGRTSRADSARTALTGSADSCCICLFVAGGCSAWQVKLLPWDGGLGLLLRYDIDRTPDNQDLECKQAYIRPEHEHIDAINDAISFPADCDSKYGCMPAALAELIVVGVLGATIVGQTIVPMVLQYLGMQGAAGAALSRQVSAGQLIVRLEAPWFWAGRLAVAVTVATCVHALAPRLSGSAWTMPAIGVGFAPFLAWLFVSKPADPNSRLPVLSVLGATLLFALLRASAKKEFGWCGLAVGPETVLALALAAGVWEVVSALLLAADITSVGGVMSLVAAQLGLWLVRHAAMLGDPNVPTVADKVEGAFSTACLPAAQINLHNLGSDTNCRWAPSIDRTPSNYETGALDSPLSCLVICTAITARWPTSVVVLFSVLLHRYMRVRREAAGTAGAGGLAWAAIINLSVGVALMAMAAMASPKADA